MRCVHLALRWIRGLSLELEGCNLYSSFVVYRLSVIRKEKSQFDDPGFMIFPLWADIPGAKVAVQVEVPHHQEH